MHLDEAKRVLKKEGEALLAQAEILGEEFDRAVELILNNKGRVVVTGMGKAGLVGRKVAATLASTGTPSFFLHPGEGVHGDLGMVTSQDIVIAFSNSGETDEVLGLLPTLKILGTPLIAVTADLGSSLADNSELVIPLCVDEEACPLNLAPTTSAVLMLALGDALAIALLKRRNFSPEKFALYHPGGALGRRLLLTVEKLMVSGGDNPVIDWGKTVKEAIFVITAKKKGAANVVDDAGKLVGIVTDGDLRRHFERVSDPLRTKLSAMMTKNPRTITAEKMAAEAMHLMEKNEITVLPVVNPEYRPIGLVHLHDVIKGLTGLR